MKIVHKNLKAGEVKLVVENAEDLWLLSQVIDAGDTLKGQTVRKLKVNEEADATKRTVFMAIGVEKTEFGQLLRVSGKITDGPEDVPRGSYHTFSISNKGLKLVELIECASCNQKKQVSEMRNVDTDKDGKWIYCCNDIHPHGLGGTCYGKYSPWRLKTW